MRNTRFSCTGRISAIDGLTKTIKFIHEAEKDVADKPAVETSADDTAEGASDFKIEF